MTTAQQIALTLSGQRAQRLTGGNWLVPCPVPSHGKGRGDRSPSLRIGDGASRLLVCCYAGCDARDVLGELRRRGLLDDRQRANWKPVAKALPRDTDQERKQHDKAAWLWSQRKPITGTIAETYLRVARKISCELPPTLGFLPARTPKRHPAMIAAFGLCDELAPSLLAAPRNVQAVHLTLLKPDGSGKADVEPNKIVIGSPSGKPIIIAPSNDLLGLAVSEGIEDALSIHQATGLGVWAAGAAGFMPKLADTLPDYIDHASVFADADPAGQRNAVLLAKRLNARGVFAEILPSAGAQA